MRGAPRLSERVQRTRGSPASRVLHARGLLFLFTGGWGKSRGNDPPSSAALGSARPGASSSSERCGRGRARLTRGDPGTGPAGAPRLGRASWGQKKGSPGAPDGSAPPGRSLLGGAGSPRPASALPPRSPRSFCLKWGRGRGRQPGSSDPENRTPPPPRAARGAVSSPRPRGSSCRAAERAGTPGASSSHPGPKPPKSTPGLGTRRPGLRGNRAPAKQPPFCGAAASRYTPAGLRAPPRGSGVGRPAEPRSPARPRKSPSGETTCAAPAPTASRPRVQAASRTAPAAPGPAARAPRGLLPREAGADAGPPCGTHVPAPRPPPAPGPRHRPWAGLPWFRGERRGQRAGLRPPFRGGAPACPRSHPRPADEL